MIKKSVQNIASHLKIFVYLAKHSIQRDMAYRLDFLSNMVSSIGWVNYTLILILVLNSVTNGFGGWNSNKMLLLSGCWMINNGAAFFLFYRNMQQVVKDVHKGDLDYVLVKPLDSQFFISFRRVIINAIPGVIQGIIVITIALSKMNYVPNFIDVLRFMLASLIALSLYYSLWFFAASLSIHFILADNLFRCVPELAEVSKFPSGAYPKYFEFIFTSLIPIIIFTTYPAEALLGLQSMPKTLYALIIGIVFLYITRRFWYWSLTKYSSASS